MFNRLTFGQSNWAMWLIAAGVLLTLLVLYNYRKARLAGGTKILAAVFKLTAVGLILAALLDPMLAVQRPQSQANRVAVVLDHSRSMNAIVGDRTAPNQSDRLSTEWREKLSSQADWQVELENDFRLRRYRFGSQLEAVDNLEATSLNETGSSIHRSLELLAERLRGVPTAGVVLMTDGQAGVENRLLEAGAKRDWKSLGFPIYPVDFGTAPSEPDLRVTEVVLRQSDFEAAPVTIMAKIEATALAGRSVEVKLVDGSSNVVEKRSLTLDGSTASHPLEFRFRPKESGIQTFKLIADLVSKADSSQPASSPDERLLANNERTIVVDRGHGPYKILYIAGRPNWEHKFLQRAVSEDAELQMTALIRIAKKEPKFSFRDMKVDSANPLFAGFEDVSDEEKEQYNEPVFVRIGVVDGNQHQKGFPRTAEELFEYQAVIIDDIEHDFFSADQQSLLRRFVSIRGGGLLMLGGTETMRGKGFRESVLAQMLPVYGEELGETANRTNRKQPPIAKYRLTREGWLEPFLRVADNELDERKVIEAMPPMQVVNSAGGLKPGAIVLSEVEQPGDDSKSAALVTQRFGKGKSAVMLVGDLWRWGLHHEKNESPPLGQAWRQMVRWLIADVPQPVTMEVETAEKSPSGRAAKLTVTARTVEFEPRDNVSVEVEITKPDGTLITGRAEPSESRAGVFEFPFLTVDEGGYRATAKVVDGTGAVVGECQAGWVHEPTVRELEKLGTNRTFLEELARETGGEVLAPNDLSGLADRLGRKPVPVMETEWKPLWNNGWVMAAVLGCLAGEWWLRRKNGLP